MKYLLLAGTLGAIMLFAIVPSVSNDAYANIFTIDNFTDDGVVAMLCDDELVDKTVEEITTFASQDFGPGPSQVIDHIRECQLQLLVDNPDDTAASTIVQGDKMYRHMSGPGVIAMSYLHYDGVADGVAIPGNARTLDLDLTNSDNLVVQYSFSDFDVEVIATLVDGDGDRASITKKLDAGTSSVKNLNFDLDAFVLVNAALSLGDIDEIALNFTNTEVAIDYTLEKIHITMVMVGGEMMPADTTALLLAGAELNAIWLLPAIAAIGIGAFVVSRKRK